MSDTFWTALITGLATVVVTGIPAILVALKGLRTIKQVEKAGARRELQIEKVHETVERVEKDVNGNLDKVRRELAQSLLALDTYRQEHEALRDRLTAANREIVTQAAQATAAAAEALKALAVVTANDLVKATAARIQATQT